MNAQGYFVERGKRYVAGLKLSFPVNLVGNGTLLSMASGKLEPLGIVGMQLWDAEDYPRPLPAVAQCSHVVEATNAGPDQTLPSSLLPPGVEVVSFGPVAGIAAPPLAGSLRVDMRKGHVYAVGLANPARPGQLYAPELTETLRGLGIRGLSTTQCRAGVSCGVFRAQDVGVTDPHTAYVLVAQYLFSDQDNVDWSSANIGGQVIRSIHDLDAQATPPVQPGAEPTSKARTWIVVGAGAAVVGGLLYWAGAFED